MGRRKEIVNGKYLCPRCEERQPTSEFYFSNGRIRTPCRTCRGVKSRKIGAPSKQIRDGKKQCTECGQWTPLEDMQKDKQSHMGRGSLCKVCKNRLNRALYGKSVSQFMKYLAGAHAASLKSRREGRSKRSKKKDIWQTTCVTAEYLGNLWVRQAGKCAITGVSMTYVMDDEPDLDTRSRTNASPDRIDNDRGYEIGNVQLVCKAVNLMKNEMDLEDLDFWCERILVSASLEDKDRLLKSSLH